MYYNNSIQHNICYATAPRLRSDDLRPVLGIYAQVNTYFICIYLSISLSLYVYIYIYICMSLSLSLSLSLYICIYIWYVCISLSICIYTYMYYDNSIQHNICYATAPRLRSDDLRPVLGDEVSVHFTAKLMNGTQIGAGCIYVCTYMCIYIYIIQTILLVMITTTIIIIGTQIGAGCIRPTSDMISDDAI